MRAGVFHKEGFDIKRNRKVVEAFLAAVRPPEAKLHQIIQPAAQTGTPSWLARRAGSNIKF